MRKLLLATVAALALLTVALPGPTLAAKDGNAETTNFCRDNYDALGFDNRGACVSFAARGGTFDPFQALCAHVEGTYSNSGGAVSPVCSFQRPSPTPRR